MLCTKCKQHPSKRSQGKGTASWCQSCSSEYERKRWAKLSHSEQRAKWLKSKYKLTWEDYEDLYKKQDGKCATCSIEIDILKKDNSRDVACVDHCHTTERIRGLLCNHCNRALGLVKDRKDVLLKMVEYLG